MAAGSATSGDLSSRAIPAVPVPLSVRRNGCPGGADRRGSHGLLPEPDNSSTSRLGSGLSLCLVWSADRLRNRSRMEGGSLGVGTLGGGRAVMVAL